MLALEVFELTKEQIDLQDLFDEGENEGKEYILAESNIIERTFVSIDNFGPYIDTDGLEYTSFWSGGAEWITMYDYRKFTEIIVAYTQDRIAKNGQTK
jgi:hypothetical protein